MGQTKDFRLRFGLRLLFSAIAMIALLTWGTLKLHDWYTSVPMGDAVATFNARAADDPVGKREPLLTEDEIFASIESQLPSLDASEQVRAIYARIARTKRLPPGAALNSIPGFSPASGEHRTVWWINLEVMTGKNSGYGLRIRETNNPAAASSSVQTKSASNVRVGRGSNAE